MQSAAVRPTPAPSQGGYRDLLAAGARKITSGDGLPLHLVACHELAFYLTVEDRKKRTRFDELLRDLVARGRAAGVIVVAAPPAPGGEARSLRRLRDTCALELLRAGVPPHAVEQLLGASAARYERLLHGEPLTVARRHDRSLIAALGPVTA